MDKSTNIETVIGKYSDTIQPLMTLDVTDADIMKMDFTSDNQALKDIDISDLKAFTAYIETVLDNYQKVGIGGYGEDRDIYRRSSLFKEEDGYRCIHLGIDIWVPAGTPIYAPINAWVHSFRDNNRFGDYGATIILEHHLNDVTFYTLYGHLSRSSLSGHYNGMEILKEEHVAEVGDSNENGQWPPHLHFQLISDMLDYRGDFPGVAPPAQKEYYLNICPNPEKLVKIR